MARTPYLYSKNCSKAFDITKPLEVSRPSLFSLRGTLPCQEDEDTRKLPGLLFLMPRGKDMLLRNDFTATVVTVAIAAKPSRSHQILVFFFYS